jgi:hypothetical protein
MSDTPRSRQDRYVFACQLFIAFCLGGIVALVLDAVLP